MISEVDAYLAAPRKDADELGRNRISNHDRKLERLCGLNSARTSEMKNKRRPKTVDSYRLSRAPPSFRPKFLLITRIDYNW
ncbi:hypothetical protein NXT3_PA00075 (plasmid) [Sinorhizobium fredii]|uniref:Uncharacterized protein n=1 Tax=Rhizobium fredii TaxID=380 RepID=A0A2L0HA41_RHIFR|nr:hypothetical protein NXT3_PA00075 [Sinorhizobium fredii]